MSGDVTNIRIEPMDVLWEIENQFTVSAIADVAGALGGKYFTFSDGANNPFYCWLDTGASVDPAPGGTGLQAIISANDSAATIAGIVQAAIDGNAAFGATVSGSVVTVTNATVTAASDAAVDVDTGFTIATCQEGGTLDLGLLDGDIAVEQEEGLFSVTAHQTGATVLAELRQSVGATLSLVLKESDFPKYKQLYSATGGGTHTPGAGTEMFGWGTSRQGDNTVVQARRLVLHPVRLAVGDHSEDVCFWKAYPKPGTLTFSGENPNTLSVDFISYLDSAKPAAIKLFAFGDYTQLVP